MQQYQLQAEGDKNRLVLVDVETPQPRPGEALVRVHAASLNYRDLIIRDGKPNPGRVPLSDGAGEVVAVGEGVSAVTVGDRVTANFFSGWLSGRFRMSYHSTALGGASDGMLTEYALLPAESLVSIPEFLSFAEAATLPCAALTAWNGLFTRGQLAPGETVLVQGTGGVSIFALQLAVAHQARVIITSSSDTKLEQARALGAWQTINYKTRREWETVVYELTGKQGADHVIEVAGPATFEQSLKAVAAGGHIAQIGVLSGFDFKPDIWPLTPKNATISGVYVGSVEQFQAMNRFLHAHQLHPIIDRTFPFTEAAAAYEYMKSGSHFGKVVITIS